MFEREELGGDGGRRTGDGKAQWVLQKHEQVWRTMQYNRGECSLGDQRCEDKSTQERERAPIDSKFVYFEHARVLEVDELGGDGRWVPSPACSFRRSADLQASRILFLTASSRTGDGGVQGVLQEHEQARYDTAEKAARLEISAATTTVPGKGTGPQSPSSSSISNTLASHSCAWKTS